jgi:hypothetical protein
MCRRHVVLELSNGVAMSTSKLLAALVLVWSLAVATLWILREAPESRGAITEPLQDALVYAALLDSLAQGGKRIVVTSAANDDQMLAGTGPLAGAIPARKLVTVVPRESLVPAMAHYAPSTDYWQEFQRRYPDADGWFDLSEVTYRDGGRAAVVTYGHHCGWLCGSGGPVDLRRTAAGGWRVTNVTVEWVS